MSDIEPTKGFVGTETLYTLCNLVSGEFILKACLLEAQDWIRFYDGPPKVRAANPNRTVKRLGAMTPEQQNQFYRLHTGKEPVGDYDAVEAELHRLAETVPVDETSIGELREKILEKWGSGSMDQRQSTKKETVKPTMTTENTTAAAPAASTATPAAAKAEKAPRPAGAKALVRQIFTENPTSSLTVEELAAKTGKPSSSITTAISDLKSSKYCKPGDPLVLYRAKDGKYSTTKPVEEAAPATPAAPATADAPADALPVA